MPVVSHVTNMRRRAYLASLAVGTSTLAGCSVMGKSPDEERPAYLEKEPIVYDHDTLELRLHQEVVHLGDTIEIEVTNAGADVTALGCHNPWALQTYADGTWRHVTWTGDRYYQTCLTRLGPGDSRVEKLTLSVPELEDQASEVDRELRPGRYRFLLIGIGTSPYPALKFDVLDSE